MQEILKLSIDFANSRFRKEAGLNGIITAWHTGAMNLEGETFSVKHLGSGEGMCYLGPGTYFSTNEKTAKAYEKYRKDATLYECKIDCSKIYNPFSGQPTHYRGLLEKILKEVLGELRINKAPYANSFDYGTLEIGQIHKLLGKDKAIEKFKQHNLSGFAQQLDHDCIEICIFDYSAVQIINKTPLKIIETPKEIKNEKSISLVDNWIKGEKIPLNKLHKNDLVMMYEGEESIFNRVHKVKDISESVGLIMECIAAPEDYQDEIGNIQTIKYHMLDWFDGTYKCHFDQSNIP